MKGDLLQLGYLLRFDLHLALQEFFPRLLRADHGPQHLKSVLRYLGECSLHLLLFSLIMFSLSARKACVRCMTSGSLEKR